MQLADEVVAVLTPNEMKTLRKKLAGWTLKTLSQQAKISITQLCQFENGVNGLRLDQIQTCEKLLLRAAAEREQAISALFGRHYEVRKLKGSRSWQQRVGRQNTVTSQFRPCRESICVRTSPVWLRPRAKSKAMAGIQ
jgi:hypothetical protein